MAISKHDVDLLPVFALVSFGVEQVDLMQDNVLDVVDCHQWEFDVAIVWQLLE